MDNDLLRRRIKQPNANNNHNTSIIPSDNAAAAATTNISENNVDTRIQPNKKKKNDDVNSSEQQQEEPASMKNRIFVGIWVCMHLVSMILFISGFILRINFHNSNECNMTWSQRRLIPIDTAAAAGSHDNIHNYQLYKFVDERDPRYRKFLSNPQTPLQGNRWCGGTNNTATAVLYIPGHWGSYMQSRSIGAHGIQLTGQRANQQAQKVIHALSHNLWSGQTAQDESSFVFEVYSVDFREEGSALHGDYLRDQTKFVQQSILYLTNNCQYTTITLLGHSFGGYVARLVTGMYPPIQQHVKHIVTLGTPHATPVFGWQQSVSDLHQEYFSLARNNNTIIVSISGGLRDEMIPPAACNIIGNQSNTLSVLATNIMKPGPNGIQPQLGMDHRAIVWCHNLLSVVRTILFQLTWAEQHQLGIDGTLQRVRKSLGMSDTNDDYYEDKLREHHEIFRNKYGFWSSTAMECAMLYHLELLVGLYAILGGWYWALVPYLVPLWQGSNILAVLGTTFVAVTWTTHDISLPSVVILVLVANSIFRIVSWLLGKLAAAVFWSNKATAAASQSNHKAVFNNHILVMSHGRHACVVYISLFLALWIGWWIVSKFFLVAVLPKLSLQACWFISTIVFLYVLAFQSVVSKTYYLPLSPKSNVNSNNDNTPTNSKHLAKQQQQQIMFVSLLIVILPCLVTGQILALVKNGTIFSWSNNFMWYNDFRIKMILPVGLQLGLLYPIVSVRERSNSLTKQKQQQIRALFHLGILFFWAPSMVNVGNGFRMGDFIGYTCWLECIYYTIMLFLG